MVVIQGASCAPFWPSAVSSRPDPRVDQSYIWNPTVCAPAYLRLVQVDEYSRMAQRTAAPVAGNAFRIYPPYRLLVNQLNGCIGLRLWLLS